ncbi:hypothetical protein [Haladaptatus sp. NG-WS-4]
MSNASEWLDGACLRRWMSIEGSDREAQPIGEVCGLRWRWLSDVWVD